MSIEFDKLNVEESRLSKELQNEIYAKIDDYVRSGNGEKLAADEVTELRKQAFKADPEKEIFNRTVLGNIEKQVALI